MFSFDEKSSVQTLDRTQPGLPLKPGRCGTMTHDYKRHGTTSLFAAMDVASGEVIGETYRRHRHQELLRFLRKVETSVARPQGFLPDIDPVSGVGGSSRSYRALPFPNLGRRGGRPRTGRRGGPPFATRPPSFQARHTVRADDDNRCWCYSTSRGRRRNQRVSRRTVDRHSWPLGGNTGSPARSDPTPIGGAVFRQPRGSEPGREDSKPEEATLCWLIRTRVDRKVGSRPITWNRSMLSCASAAWALPDGERRCAPDV